jgi:nitroimidazol reductase NimA-like FMN-containing flavoprotein (pyridoxamine 5'-phosphate oxidase superfamily)
MTPAEASSARAKVRQHPERAHYDAATIEAILAEGLLCHVAFVEEGAPVCIPTTYAPFEGGVVLHGAVAGRMIERLSSGVPVCFCVTLLDGLVLARSALFHSMNYRSVVAFARGVAVTDPARKRAMLAALVEHVVPGRLASIRAPTDTELAATGVVWLPLDEASAKVRAGPPRDKPADQALPAWAGTIPLRLAPGAPETDAHVPPGTPLPPHVERWPLREST